MMYSRRDISSAEVPGALCIRYVHWRRSRVKSGGIKIEKIEGVGSGEGLCPSQLESGACPKKKK